MKAFDVRFLAAMSVAAFRDCLAVISPLQWLDRKLCGWANATDAEGDA